MCNINKTYSKKTNRKILTLQIKSALINVNLFSKPLEQSYRCYRGVSAYITEAVGDSPSINLLKIMQCYPLIFQHMNCSISLALPHMTNIGPVPKQLVHEICSLPLIRLKRTTRMWPDVLTISQIASSLSPVVLNPEQNTWPVSPRNIFLEGLVPRKIFFDSWNYTFIYNIYISYE